MNFVTTSIFDIFKIGPGPSSSHTIGPMLAALNFRNEIAKLAIKESSLFIEVHLYGSLSATGKGHGTDKAILAGLMGSDPKNCDTDILKSYFANEEDKYLIEINEKKINFDYDAYFYEEIHHLFPYSNTIILQLKSKDKILLEKEYYSIGGGFILSKDENIITKLVVPFPYCNMTQLKKKMVENNLSLNEIMLANEMSISKSSKEKIYEELFKIIDIMERSIERGIQTEGVLPGSLKLERRAFSLHEFALKSNGPDSFLFFLNAYAIAASEENAAGHLVVTAPTSGACGVIPAIIMVLKRYFQIDNERLAEGLLSAAAIGFIAKHNASISGAEVGCQGEIGVAQAMAAALIAQVKGSSIEVIESAAEIALEHQLGLTCDPIKGYVQIPCIERNAQAASGAFNAYRLAISSPKKKISFDQVVEVMLQTGRDMCLKYKETSKGGLALCKIDC